jgi:2-isopropylmalate synthase
MKVFTFDTTLRDGTQGEGISLSVNDKFAIARKLDELGIDYIEAGWPGSNPKDDSFFAQSRELKLEHARLTAFGSTRLAKCAAHEDPRLLAIAAAGTSAVTIFGKTWDLHVVEALRISLDQNLLLISDTVGFLKAQGKEVIFDAEHFFDGYAANPDYALRTLDVAKGAGADVLCLCDTNGGTLPGRLREIVGEVCRRFGGVVGIHSHNDSDLAVANALAAVEAGATLVQGCLNGYGERCGNAALASVIANLELKMDCDTIGREKLAELAPACRFVAEIANRPLHNAQAFVGNSAFAHKGGVHVSAVLRNSATYEHVSPEAVGNERRVLVSDLAGRANIAYQLKHHPLGQRLDDRLRGELLQRIKQLEAEGYDLEGADGTFELLAREILYEGEPLFQVASYHVSTGKHGDHSLHTVATVTLQTQDQMHTASAVGRGPLHALDRCLSNGLAKLYPRLKRAQLADYQVRFATAVKGSATKVRVLLRWSEGSAAWATIGVSESVVEASWMALVDAARLELLRVAQESGVAAATGGVAAATGGAGRV